MADFVAVLKKTIEGLKNNTPEMREKVYKKARATIEAKLEAITPPPPKAAADRQRKSLEDAIEAVELEYSTAEPEAEDAQAGNFDEVFTSFAAGNTDDDDAGDDAVAPPPAISRGGRDAPVLEEDPGAARIVPARDRYPAADNSDDAEDESEYLDEGERPARARRSYGMLAAAAVLALVVVAGGAAAWMNRDGIASMVGLGPEVEVASADADAAADAGGEEAATETAGEAGEPASEKFTQRLTEEGEEVDPGPASGAATVGEGTSVAAATQPGNDDAGEAAQEAAPAAPEEETAATDGQVPVGQQAIFYEERTSNSVGTAEQGSTVWSLVEESPGGELPPEPAIRAEVTVPEKDIQVRITVRRNVDESLPASHIIEMIFLTPEGFGGGGIENVLRVTMKESEQDTGNPLFGIPARIADGFFLFALSDNPAETETNVALLRGQGWMDIPVVYKSGRRALVTIEKGIPGEQVFNQAVEAWQNGSSG